MKYFSIRNLTGINRNVSPLIAEAGQMLDAQNMSAEKVGVLKKTGDYELKNAQITASYSILGGVDFVRNSGTHTHIVACDGASNADIYEDVTGTWTAASQSLTAGSSVRFAYSPALDTLFAVNYSDATRSYNGSSWSTSTNVTSAPKAKDVLSFGNRIYLLNCAIDATTYPARAYRSSLVDTGSITWDTTNDWFVFDDTIVGGGFVGENMFIVCQNSTHVLTLTDEKYRVSSIGGISLNGIAWFSSFAFYASREGIFVFDGSNTQLISEPIKEYWSGIPEASLDDIQLDVINRKLYVYVGNITEPETMTNVLFEYEIMKNNWNKISLGTSATNLHKYITTTGEKLFMGDTNGKVYKMFSSDSQDTSSFTSYIETNWIYGSDSKAIDDFYEFWGYGEKLSGISVYYKIDDSDWTAAGQLNGCADFVKFKASGYRIKFLLHEESKNNMYELYGFEVGYMPRYISEDNQE